MYIAKYFLVFLMAISLLMAMDAIAENDVYRWVDENGVVHFGDQATGPEKAEKVAIKKAPINSRNDDVPPPSGPQPIEEPSYAQQRRDERAKNRSEAAKREQAMAADCKRAQQLVARLEPSTRVMVQHEDGTVSRLDDNERLESLANAKDFFARNCSE